MFEVGDLVIVDWLDIGLKAHRVVGIDGDQPIIDNPTNPRPAVEGVRKISKELGLYYCTFGLGQVYENHVQPILARNKREAESVMFQVYGQQWGFSYSEADWKYWKKQKENVEKELEILDARKVLLSDYVR